MQMHILHETRYRYERPVKYSVQSLHLTPRRDQCQRKAEQACSELTGYYAGGIDSVVWFSMHL